jgi:DNA-binding NtrC family response regulator
MTLSPKRTRETILLVEDDPLVLKLVTTILENAGFFVLAATNSTEAMKIEGGFGGTIDLLLSDVMMPDMSGPVIAKLLKKYRPEMHVMMMSGYPESGMLVHTYGWCLLQKPFVAEALVEKVNEVLDSPNRGQHNDYLASATAY